MGRGDRKSDIRILRVAREYRALAFDVPPDRQFKPDGISDVDWQYVWSTPVRRDYFLKVAGYGQRKLMAGWAPVWYPRLIESMREDFESRGIDPTGARVALRCIRLEAARRGIIPEDMVDDPPSGIRDKNQVKRYKEYLDSLEAKLPGAGTATGAPDPPLPADSPLRAYYPNAPLLETTEERRRRVQLPGGYARFPLDTGEEPVKRRRVRNPDPGERPDE